jgi:hypothetical protein
LRKETNPELVKDTLFKTLLDEPLFVSGKINPRGQNKLSKSLDLNMAGKVLGISLFFYPTAEQEKLVFYRKDSLRQDPLEDFTLKEIQGNSFTYLPEYQIETLALTLVDQANKVIWTNFPSPASSRWKKSPNSKANYSYLVANEEWSPQLLTLTIGNRTKLYDTEITMKIMAVYTEDFLINQEKELKKVEEKYVLTLL